MQIRARDAASYRVTKKFFGGNVIQNIYTMCVYHRGEETAGDKCDPVNDSRGPASVGELSYHGRRRGTLLVRVKRWGKLWKPRQGFIMLHIVQKNLYTAPIPV